MSDALLVLAGANLAAAAAVVLVMILRTPARKLFGPRIAYGLWLLVPLAALGMLLPARVVTVTVRAASGPAAEAASPAAQAVALGSPVAGAIDPWPLATGLWIAGTLASLAWLGWRQVQFGRDAEAGLAGPAAVGVLQPRVITPSDFGRRYSPREQFVVLAHEETHIARHDTRINALVAAARCVNWFNPMLHVLARCLRIDQELACDAQVIASYPKVRRAYAEAMLKTQLAARPLPLGCYWPPARAHPLAERIQLLSRAAPHPGTQALGIAMLATLTLAVAGSAWAVKPTRVQVVERPAAADFAPAPVLSRIGAIGPAPLPPMSSRRARPEPPVAPSPPADPSSARSEALFDAQAAPTLPERDRPRWADDRGSEPRPEPNPRPPRRIFTAANRSFVEPGSAVRVVGATIDAEGRPLTVDLTSYGSQRRFRTGSFLSFGRERLFVSVTQKGERLWVTASPGRRFDPSESVTVEMRSGETREVDLPDGRRVTITPTVRAETPEERADEGLRRIASEFERSGREAWRAYRDR